MRLIVNGDDFGYSLGQNYGIVEAYQQGILRSTSLMVSGRYAEHALRLAKEHPDLGVGVHLIIDYGRPQLTVEEIPSLVTEDGLFRRPAFEGPLDVAVGEVEKEWRAQIQWVKAQGICPTHLDSHHHFHLHPQLLATTCSLAQEFGLPIRTLPPGWSEEGTGPGLSAVRRPDASLVDFYNEGVGEEFFTGLLLRQPELKEKTVEVMCHPAFLDDFLLEASSYTLPRVRELKVLKSAPVNRWVQENQVELISYRQL